MPPRRRRTLSVGLAALTALGLTGAAFAKDVAVGREDDALVPIGSLVADDDLDPRILGLELDGRSWNRAVDELDAALFARADATRRAEFAATELAAIRAERSEHQRTLGARRVEAAGLDDRIAEHEAALRERALELYVSFGDSSDLESLRSPTDAASDARVKQLADEVDEAQLGLRRSLRDRRDSVGGEIDVLVRRIAALNAEESMQTRRLMVAVDDRAAGAAAVEDATVLVRDARRRADVVGVSMAVVALDAYLSAESLLADERPRCRLEWWMIAGVGRVESVHGELGGRTIEPDGRVSTPIIGIALDGGPGVRAVVDTDDGELDDDALWDRAVGPMQFIPETWSRRSADGDGDGVADPQNIYDAAYTTGRFLCALGGDLSEADALEAAYFGYNTSDEYVADVLAHARRYQAFPLPPHPLESEEIATTSG